MTIQQAQKKEQEARQCKDRTKARKLFLDAAEYYLMASQQDRKNEKVFVEKATALYVQAQEIEVSIKQEDSTPSFASVKKPTMRFSNVGGLEELKESIAMKIIRPLKHPYIYKHFKKKIGGGILMYGPPGCGKSLIAEATAGEANATFFNVKSSDLKGKYVGETEKNIAALFAEARKRQPSIIFFDEFEALGSDRSEAGEHQRNAVAQLLTEMNGVGTKDDQILVLAATNEPWSIDLALKREGRFGDTLLVPHPDFDSRVEILKLALQDKPIANINIEEVALMTDGFSGADMGAIVNYATDAALKKYFETLYLQDITQQDLVQAIQQVQPRVREWYAKAQKKVNSEGVKVQDKPVKAVLLEQ
jgi:transitional endoplasmic reticulum ATPase